MNSFDFRDYVCMLYDYIKKNINSSVHIYAVSLPVCTLYTTGIGMLRNARNWNVSLACCDTSDKTYKEQVYTYITIWNIVTFSGYASLVINH